MAINQINPISSSFLILLLIIFPIFSFTTILPTTLESSGDGGGINQAHRQKRIVGGDPVPIRSVPWQALILQQIDDSFHHCGAVLIGPEWILTAAHCIVDLYPIKAYFGLNNIAEIFPRPGRIWTRTVIKVYYPHYYDRNLSGDVVLLKLNQTLEMNEHVRWIKLPEFPKNFENFDYRIGLVSGYGTTMYPEPPKIADITMFASRLHSVRVPILPRSSCIRLYTKKLKDGYKVSGWMKKNKLICAGQTSGGHDACRGDSGGPLAVCTWANSWKMPRMEDDSSSSSSRKNLIMRYLLERQRQNQNGHPSLSCPNGEWQLAGIVSSGFGCGLPGNPGFYTDIRYFSKWIHSIIDHD